MTCNDTGYQAISFDEETHLPKVNCKWPFVFVHMSPYLDVPYFFFLIWPLTLNHTVALVCISYSGNAYKLESQPIFHFYPWVGNIQDIGAQMK